ncbi:unnamed protein product [Rotaria magnacalcarata]
MIITTILYASGAAAYGISIEIYFLLPFVIVNCILCLLNCGIDHSKTTASIIYIVKTFVLLVATELSFQNFKCFTFQQSYKLNYQAATRPRSNSPHRIPWECVGSRRNPWYWIPTGSCRMSESVGFLGFRQDPGHSGIFRHPTTSCRNPIPRIPPTSDEFPSDPIKFDNFPLGSDRIRLSDCSSWGAILRQSLYLTVTITFLVSPGLRAVYNGVRYHCPYKYQGTDVSSCNIIDMGQPDFGETDSCLNDYTIMVASMEQSRIIRDISLCSIAFYSIYNRAFFDITGTGGIIHTALMILFVAMSSSFIIANIDPFEYNKVKLYFNLIELVIFTTTTVLLGLNLWKKDECKKYMVMEKKPIIFG